MWTFATCSGAPEGPATPHRRCVPPRSQTIACMMRRRSRARTRADATHSVGEIAGGHVLNKSRGANRSRHNEVECAATMAPDIEQRPRELDRRQHGLRDRKLGLAAELDETIEHLVAA